jgi:superfamily I DNA/RNA helicase
MNIHVAHTAVRWSPQQESFLDWCQTGEGSALVEAVAGAGKTTVLLEGVTRLRGESWVMAFNSSVGEELKVKLEQKLRALGHGDNHWKVARAGTCHSFGYGLLRKAFPGCRKVDNKLQLLFDELFDADNVATPYRDTIISMVDVAKNQAIGLSADKKIADNAVWHYLIDKYEYADCEAEGREEGFDPTSILISAGKILLGASARRTDMHDFTDMIYLPIYHQVKRFPLANIVMDEVQDTNALRRAFAKYMLKRNGRFIGVGDPRQAIYAFTGSDSDAMDILRREFNCQTLPLTITYRCPKQVVEFAHQWVNHITAAATAPEGSVAKIPLEGMLNSYRDQLNKDAVVLCRNTKPLVSLFFKLLKMRVPCMVEGKDIAVGLAKLTTRWSRIKTTPALEEKLADYLAARTKKLLADEKPQQADALADQVGALLAITQQCRAEGQTNVEHVVNYIDCMFGKNVDNILTLSTIHKSKGREWKRVFWLDRAGTCPSPYAKTAEAQIQEANLCYVAATRAMESLYDVTVPPKKG